MLNICEGAAERRLVRIADLSFAQTKVWLAAFGRQNYAHSSPLIL